MGSKCSLIAVVVVVFLLMALLSSALPSSSAPRKQREELVGATAEMQKANYFTFVMLINMSPPDQRLQGNVTFLMPNDRILSNMAMPEGAVASFLLRHSIPSPLLFDALQQFPTGTIVPSSLPNYMLTISNNGRKSFVLNNVKIISPNICAAAGSSIRCHGIDAVLLEQTVSANNSTFPSPPYLNITDNSSKASPPVSSSPSYPSPSDNLSPPLLIAPSPIEADLVPQRSGSSHWLPYNGPLNFATCLMLALLGFYF
ncbi:hypothetical protein L6164_035349 [Bauhinia variegata]|uniref:Uncharacterized protein n=1 Tax=Bauhinia variegata TaxID=167791 RepID=A0ACB9KDP5_BAUVA|nr:hypothetical protein L6164_035349 [Bauhinia variegata]